MSFAWLWLVALAAGIIFILWQFIEAADKKDYGWMFIIFILPLLGAVLYYMKKH